MEEHLDVAVEAVAATEDGERHRPNKRRTRSSNGADDSGARGTMRRELVEDQIFAVASKLFAERGFAGVSVQDIADAMGMTRPALYYYFKNKDELLAQLVSETTEAPAAEIQRLAAYPDSDATGRFRHVAHAMALRRATDPNRFLLLVRSEAELPSDLAAAHRSAQRATLRELIRLIEAGIQSGQFRPVDARTTALALIGMCNWIAWWQSSLGSRSPSEIADQIADLALAMVRHLDGPGAGIRDPRAAIAQVRADLEYLERILAEGEKE